MLHCMESPRVEMNSVTCWRMGGADDGNCCIKLYLGFSWKIPPEKGFLKNIQSSSVEDIGIIYQGNIQMLCFTMWMTLLLFLQTLQAIQLLHACSIMLRKFKRASGIAGSMDRWMVQLRHTGWSPSRKDESLFHQLFLSVCLQNSTLSLLVFLAQ